MAPHPFMPQPWSQKLSVACQVHPDLWRQEEQDEEELQDFLSTASSVEVAMEKEIVVPRVKAKTKRRIFLMVVIGLLGLDVECIFRNRNF